MEKERKLVRVVQPQEIKSMLIYGKEYTSKKGNKFITYTYKNNKGVWFKVKFTKNCTLHPTETGYYDVDVISKPEISEFEMINAKGEKELVQDVTKPVGIAIEKGEKYETSNGEIKIGTATIWVRNAINLNKNYEKDNEAKTKVSNAVLDALDIEG